MWCCLSLQQSGIESPKKKTKWYLSYLEVTTLWGFQTFFMFDYVHVFLFFAKFKKGETFCYHANNHTTHNLVIFFTTVGGLSYQQFSCLVQSISYTSSSSVKLSELLLSASQSSSSHDFVTMNNLWVRICRIKVCSLRQALSTRQVRDQELSKFKWLNCNARNAQWSHGHS